MLLSDVLKLVPVGESVVLCDNSILSNHPIYASAQDLLWWLDCDQYPVEELSTDSETGDIRIMVNIDMLEDSDD